MYGPRFISVTILLSVVLSVGQGISDAAETASQAATRLVDLIKPHESEALAVRFMVSLSPLALPEGVADCTVSKVTPAWKDNFARLYGSHLREAELHDAVTFFESNEGKTAVEFRLQHEQDVYTAAAKLETVVSEHPVYPPRIQKALDAFGLTAAGKVLTGENAVALREPFRREVSVMRDSAFAECIGELAAGNSRNSGTGSSSPAESIEKDHS